GPRGGEPPPALRAGGVAFGRGPLGQGQGGGDDAGIVALLEGGPEAALEPRAGGRGVVVVAGEGGLQGEGSARHGRIEVRALGDRREGGVGEVRATEREVGGGGGQDGRGRARGGRRVGPRAVVHGRERPHGIDRVGHELLGGAGRGVGERCEGGGERQRGVIEAAHARVGRRHERARRRGGGRRRAGLGARTSPVA